MKQGRTIQSLASEVLRREETKRDFLVPSEVLTLSPEMNLGIPDRGEFPLTEHAHNQLGEATTIPAKHYDRLRSAAPHLLAAEVNFFLRSEPKPRMVRTMEDHARAVLSSRYRRFDNFDLLNSILPIILDDGSLQVASSEITEQRLYLKIIKPSIEAEIVKGDVVRAGFTVSNSEIGTGGVSVLPYLERLACLNGMVVSEFGQRRNHVGRVTESSENYELYSDATLQLEDSAFWAKCADLVRATLDQSKAALIFGKLRESVDMKITGDPAAAVKELSNKYSLSEDQRGSVLRNFLEGGMGANAWSLSNAVTALANSTESYDEASRLEIIGGKIATMPPADWKAIGAAA